MVEITVITPSLPDRYVLLAEACRSVASQYYRPAAHLIGIDHNRRGPAIIRNELLAAVTTDWVAFLDDDDVLGHEHLETLIVGSAGFDVIGAHCKFDGPPIPPKFCNRPYDREVLRQHNIMPITFLARTAAIRDSGGFRSEDRYEDWSLLNRMADNDCHFKIIPKVTWTYRTSTPDRRTIHAA